MRIQPISSNKVIVEGGLGKRVEALVAEAETHNASHIRVEVPCYTGEIVQLLEEAYGTLTLVIYAYDDGPEYLPEHLKEAKVVWEIRNKREYWWARAAEIREEEEKNYEQG